MEAFDERDEKAEAIKAVLKTLIEHLVDSPEDAKLSHYHGEQTTVIEIRVHPHDIGKIIGKKGQNISAMRTLLVCMAAKNKLRAVMTLVEE